MRRTLSVCPSVCLSFRPSVRPVIVAIGNVFSTTASVTSRHLANYNDTDTHVLLVTHRGPHIVVLIRKANTKTSVGAIGH